MPTVRDHVNKPVISTSDGRKLGKIKDLYLDSRLARVIAVYLGGSGIFRRKKLLIEREKVQTCGLDAWLVGRADVVAEAKQVAGSQNFVPAKELHSRKIISEGGTEIAEVDDVILDGECNVLGFSLSKISASGPLAERKAIALGAITNFGGKDRAMITTLSQAESMPVGASAEVEPPKETGS